MAVNIMTLTIQIVTGIAILYGILKFIISKPHLLSAIMNNSFIKLKAEGYKVKNIVEYDREAYYLPYGNIRITFDLNLRTYNTDTNFNKISNSSIKILPNNTNILEVKFSLPLPDYLKNLLSKTIATRCSISKFVMGQKFMNFSPWNDNITEPF